MDGTDGGADPTAGSTRTPTRIVRLLTALGIAIAAAMLVLGGLLLLDARRDAWRRAEQAANNLALTLERDIGRNIAAYDLSLQGVIEALQQPGLDDASLGVRRTALFDRAATAEFLGSVLVLDRDGNVTESSISLLPPRLNLADRDYFQAQRDRLDAGLFVSRPYRSRLRQGDISIAISRRLPDASGQFAGIVMGALRIAYFQELFASLDLGPGGSVTLFRLDGRVIARHPFNDADIDRDLSGSANFRRFAAEGSGSFVGRAAIDGVERLYNFRRVGNLPLMLAVATSVEDIYAAWRTKALGIGAILIFLCGASVALSLLFRRELLRRFRAETALAQAARKLAVLAATDGLTGLANRRQFDEALEREWRRAVRSGTPIALLLLDADNFKFYNDHYGHLEGDNVLRSIADCVRLLVRRPADTGARYGGEEFAVLLPETDAVGAAGVAERLRARVESLAIPHEGRPEGRVTVSIGVAVARARHGDQDSVLVREADAALYAAKSTGRNRVATADGSDPSLQASEPVEGGSR
ncbi:GGDEF domain-containing protein [Plastoroseomonas hellenica]|uniref:GGDEF domain-containing protein n=1 Tax=Plastoroseomonas hellenica TaxID=2687306 RepID=UPI001BADC1C3|nr:GGDEF domain-containing protein [Plastoroseomonas hellenica]MBR0647344.1 GGDEF domain-containing protein [Plastoroseomonas hellenica]